jgi:hypothetical protein
VLIEKECVFMKAKIVRIISFLLCLIVTAALFPSAVASTNELMSYDGHWYRFMSDMCTWDEARIACENMGGYLTAITSFTEMNFVSGMISNSTNSNGIVWIGGTDREIEGDWKWVSGEKFVYTNWKSIYEPNNYNNEDYLQIDANPGWNDANGQQQCFYVCEWNSKPESTSSRETMEQAVSSSIDHKSRSDFKAWCDKSTIAEINQFVGKLSKDERRELCDFLLDSTATGSDREKLLQLMTIILSFHDLGFYVHIFSYTTINLEGDGFFYWGGQRKVTLARNSFLNENTEGQRNLLIHECFHSFNDANNGPIGALDEGAAIWIFKAVFGVNNNAEDFAEATYGTKLYYKYYMNNAACPLQAPSAFTGKLVEVYTWLSENDPSHLPWWDQTLLQAMYEKYYAALNRDVNFQTVWLPSVKKAREAMLKDPLMLSQNRKPMPTVAP